MRIVLHLKFSLKLCAILVLAHLFQVRRIWDCFSCYLRFNCNLSFSLSLVGCHNTTPSQVTWQDFDSTMSSCSAGVQLHSFSLSLVCCHNTTLSQVVWQDVDSTVSSCSAGTCACYNPSHIFFQSISDCAPSTS